MKLKLVAVAVTSLLAAGAVNAAEVYNKDANKLDIYGKVHAQHYFSDDNGSDGDKTYNTKPVLQGLAFSLDVDSVIRSMPCRHSLVVVFADRVILPSTSKCWMSMPAIVRCVRNGLAASPCIWKPALTR